MKKLEKVVAVIPAFNEEATIEKILKETRKYVDEQILIDDCSSDNTHKIAEKYALVFRNKNNLGYDASLNKGFELAKRNGASIIITLDADGQHNSDEIPNFVNPIKNNAADIVVGIRPFTNRFMEKIFRKYGLKKFGVDDPLCGMKAYNIKVYENAGFFDNMKSIGTQLTFLSSLKGYRVLSIPINYNKRKDTPRFGNQIKGNIKLFYAYLRLKKYFR